MSKNESDKLVDTVMGEAVLALLDSDDDVSFDALIGQLQESLMSEVDSTRRKALQIAISGIHHYKTQPASRGRKSNLQVSRLKNRLPLSGPGIDNKARKH
ncbi:hypothetical protein PU683_14460 [Kosakonia cowanii]|uniref:hypothetical protein n=1 Tax=Kosakonia cowanii TaxID=208223 RepID=UPI0023F6849C|nr:hypothetical protein [Kosakonia cowanii]MDF7760723.1 hypothetical protein [Kosakonia cowanii]